MGRWVIGLLLTACAGAWADEPVAAKDWARALAGVPSYVWADGPVRDKARKELEALLDRPLTKAQAKQLAELLAKGDPFKTEKTASGTFEIPAGEGSEKTKVWFAIPPKYRKAKEPAGLVIACHGGPPQDLAQAFTLAPQEFSYFSSPVQQYGLFLCAPAWTGDPTAIVLETIREASKRWNIDRNRVWMVGHSAGGVASFMVAPPWADRFAGIAPFVCGIEHGNRLNNTRLLPVYHVLGLKDNPFFLETGRKNSKKLQEVGGPLKVVEKNGGHDVYPDECDKCLAWLTPQPRRFWSKEVSWSPDSARTAGGFYWVESEAGATSGRGGKAAWKVSVGADNAVTVEGDGVTGLLLCDELVDLDKPVTVKRGDAEAFAGAAPRTLRVALEWVAATGDFSAVPCARVKLAE